ncbi:MAG TPA: AbrB/MazE/SpoVT family DNA-binding domain-containing protein [Firmicutes bacterium]|jgi:AbrB family looped-hinge helix DNA binding protein|nr:AbrB/MazE/SpoVT family DNA-binding domain-containing protein [Bacillota bacterium]
MEKITVLPGFQITIPREIRKKFRLQPGQEVRIILVEDRIEIVPVKQEEESQEAMARE